jgi:hypothetical protein
MNCEIPNGEYSEGPLGGFHASKCRNHSSIVQGPQTWTHPWPLASRSPLKSLSYRVLTRICGPASDGRFQGACSGHGPILERDLMMRLHGGYTVVHGTAVGRTENRNGIRLIESVNCFSCVAHFPSRCVFFNFLIC